MPDSPIIIWDVDDVLNRLMYSWLKHLNQEMGLKFKLNDINENPPHRILGITRDDYFISLDIFRNSEAGKQVQANNTLKNWFKKYGHRYNHMACTARPINTMPNQAWWVFHHFGRWIHTVHSSHTSRDMMKNRRKNTKAEFISVINKKVLFIDDLEENINDVSKTGADTILYPHPWNISTNSEQEFIEELNNKLNL